MNGTWTKKRCQDVHVLGEENLKLISFLMHAYRSILNPGRLPPSLVTGTLRWRPLPTSLLAQPPSLTVSSVSHLAPTECCEEIERSEAHAVACPDSIYFEDKDVEIACRDTEFQAHSRIIPPSSSLHSAYPGPDILRNSLNFVILNVLVVPPRTPYSLAFVRSLTLLAQAHQRRSCAFECLHAFSKQLGVPSDKSPQYLA
jgi:hypothetical protein